jgi:YidC/Oxa1 family membrane protein insertase
MDKNLWLAVALSIGVYASWFGYFEKRFNPPQARPGSASRAPSGLAATGSAPAESAPAAPAGNLTSSAPPDRATVLAESDTVYIGNVEARIHPRGAAIVSFLYPEPLGRVELVEDASQGLFSTFPELTFKRDPSVKNGVVYTATRTDGLKISKEYLPGAGTVLPRVRVVAVNTAPRPVDTGAWMLSVGPGLGTIESEKKDNDSVQRVLALTPEAGGLKGRIEALKPGAHAAPYRWIGIDNRYFLAALMPSDQLFAAARAETPAKLILTAKPVTISARGSFTWEIPFYLGAKGHTWLSRYGAGLERAIDFGFFATFGRWMLSSLMWLNDLIGNWGWSIVILTLVLQILLFPLTWKSLRAAGAMKKLQPEIVKIQQKYADDPQKISAETMALYKARGANPLGGCLPMLLQMPIFIALFNALRNSWELHGATWMFWIRDLSAKDPYYALPVIMGALMFVQTKMNPPAGDPAQQKIMMFMPVMMTFMFMNFPSGLVLYWLTNSLVSTVLQVGLKKQLEA